MVKSKNKSSSNQSLKNMHPLQFNNSKRNVNQLGGYTHTVNTADMNVQSQNMMPNSVTQNIANMNKQNPNMIPNAVTQLPELNSALTINDILNNYIGGQNSSNSLFTSGHDLSPQTNFLPTFDGNHISSDNGKHPLLDQSNFPPLINKNNLSNNGPRDNIGIQYSNTVPVERPYGKHSPLKKFNNCFSLMKTSNSDASEFKMRNKDFPALPGTQIQMKNVANTMPTVIDSNKQWNTTNIGSEQLNKLDMDQFIGHNSSRSYLNTDFHMNGRTVPKPGVQISLNDGKVTNIPKSMLRDQFGIIGQLVTMKTAEYDPKLVTLAFGQDLTNLGLNLNSPENIYPTFAGPFENFPLGPHNTEFKVPSEYLIHDKIKNKLAPINLSEYEEDLLFYLFYTHFGDRVQIPVANELYTRGWRYHIQLKLWIIPVSGSNMSEINSKFERGTFYVFDAQLWRKVPRELMLDTMLDACFANDTFIPPCNATG